jgi:putative nucleotidyltransferase with HDIG domain/diguanylate cyclase (GGDEF)-like protein
MPKSAMEAKHATDCAPWKEGIDPDAARSIAGAIDELAEFPVLDATVLRVIALCDDQDSTAADLVDALEQDATFAANLLRFANSAARATPIRAKTIRQAVMLVGRRALRRLALEAATYRFLERSRGNGRASCGQLHLHAITVAIGAAAAAEEARVPGDTVHLAGLLHDVGKLVLPEVFGEEACDAMARELPAGADRVLAERERFGIDHAQAGGLLCLAWKMPAEVAAAVAMHHGGDSGTAVPDRAVACMQIANGVVAMVAEREPERELLAAALAATRLDPSVFDEVAAVGLPGAPATGALARRFGDGARRGGGVDGLTQLPDRDAWAEAVDAQGGEGSVVVLDVDGLAAINAAHGTRVGDYVLTQLARAVMPHGIAGRVGGDEIALFAELPFEDAEELAAAIARQVSAGFAQLDGPPVRVTASVSLRCLSPQ